MGETPRYSSIDCFMKNAIFQANIAGHTLTYSLVDPATRFQFHPILRHCEVKQADIQATPERLALARTMLPPDSSDAYAEYRVLI